MGGILTYNPGQQFIIRAQTLASGTAAQTMVFGKNDLEQISGTYLSATTGGTNSFVDTKLGSTNTWLGRTVEWISCTNTANNGKRRVITGYTVSSQTATNTLALPAAITAGDTYKILSPCPSVAKVGLSAVSRSHTGAALDTALAFRYTMTAADGKKYASGYANASTSPVHQGYSYAVPIEMSLADGDLTVVVDAQATFAVTNDFYLVFVY